ncbi:hypothetical protein FS749_009345 [Ceratobasidium sp. UAMH 11750]|nr:hypothetical protein FS749_009345 [Ceratobasidium sp. UAMH 11750]
MSALKEGIKHLLKEAVPLPGISSLVQACDSGDSNVAHKEAAITRHVEDLKKSLERLNTIDRTRQVEFKDQLDHLIEDYRRNNTSTNRLSRLAKVAETLEALDKLSEQITRSIQSYTVGSIGDHSEVLKSIDDDLKSTKANVEERISKNEVQMSSFVDMLKNLKGLLNQAAESLTSLTPSSLAQSWTESSSSKINAVDLSRCCYKTLPTRCHHRWGVAFRKYSQNGHSLDPMDFLASYISAVHGGHSGDTNHASLAEFIRPSVRIPSEIPPRDEPFYPYHRLRGWSPYFTTSTANQGCTTPSSFDTLGVRPHQASLTNASSQGSTSSPANEGCTTPRHFDIYNMFSPQMSAIQVIAKCFRNMASSIRVDPDMPIHAWSHSCEPMAST